jgi:hypothetical protein
MPLGTSGGGFVFKLDPDTGLQARTATTFGPSFAERALTTGAGKISVGANFAAATYDKLGDASLDGLREATITAQSTGEVASGHLSLVLSSQTVTIQGTVGATDDLDFGVAIPFVKVKVDGVGWTQNDTLSGEEGGPSAGDCLPLEDSTSCVLTLAPGKGLASGLGDIALLAKYRFVRFGGGEPDPGGLAVVGVVRLPTGDEGNLRGLGITRTLASLVASMGRGRFRPHGNVGYEWWSEGKVVQDEQTVGSVVIPRVRLKDQIQYAAGLEFEAGPKLTFLVDFLGRHVLGGGELDFTSAVLERNGELADAEFLAASTTRLRKLTLVPGLKWNVRGTFVLALNALIPVQDNGLHDLFTPVVGLDWTF